MRRPPCLQSTTVEYLDSQRSPLVQSWGTSERASSRAWRPTCSRAIVFRVRALSAGTVTFLFTM